MRSKLWILLLIVALALVACGGDDDDSSDNGDSNGDDAPAEQSQSTPRNYEITISGDAEFTIPPGAAQAEFYEAQGRYELFFGQMSHSMYFELDDAIEPGTYDLEVPDDFNADQVASAQVTFAVDPDSLAAGAEDFDDEISGTITVDEVGDALSGSFEFTAVYADTDDAGAEIRKEIMVSGSFTDVQVRRNE